MSSKGVNPKAGQCQNCDHPLDDQMSFCPKCGQKAMPEHLTIKYFVHELMNHFLSFDSKFFNTLWPLITKPAFLSLEFIAGRRIRFINPIQLFISISFLYFLVDSLMFLKDSEPIEDSYVVFTDDNKQRVDPDTLDMEVFALDTLINENDADDDDSLIVSIAKNFVQKALEFNELDRDEQNERINQMISYFIFILTPLFALLLGWFFKTKNRHYLENLIFALHIHAFYFFIAIIFMLFDRIIPDSISDISFITLIIIYLLLALKRFYSRKWVSSVFRLIGLGTLYGFMVMVCFLCSVVLSILI